jgi:hypothetical protein
MRCRRWGCPRCGQLQPVVETYVEFFSTCEGYSHGSYAEHKQWCLRCGRDLCSVYSEDAEDQALRDPEASPLPPTDAEAVGLLVAILDEGDDYSLIFRSDVAWCLQKILQVADASLDDTDPPHLQLAAQTIARVADDQAEHAARLEAQQADRAQAQVDPITPTSPNRADWWKWCPRAVSADLLEL